MLVLTLFFDSMLLLFIIYSHDVTAKMFLTGVLIYVPPASRAGVAILICFIIIGNLNYFKPNKQKPLFWLSYLSFYVSGTCDFLCVLVFV